ncbi:hypothetical protein DUG81_01300 [Vibrio parahaemolyticus]|nr:hypothetical protein [Vibrio parahaemolyticus]
MYKIVNRSDLNHLKNNSGSISPIDVYYDNENECLYLYGIKLLEPISIEINCNTPFENFNLDFNSINIIIKTYPEFFI